MNEIQKFVCGKCGFQAANSTTFKDDKPPFGETLQCPKCGYPEIVSERISKFRKGWRLIIESGLSGDIQSIKGAYLQLAEESDKNIDLGNMKIQDIPADVALRLQTKMRELQEAVLESGILERLKSEGIHLKMHVTD